MSYSIGKLGAVSASTILALVPIVSVLLAMVFLEQQVTAQMGISIVICSVGIACYSGLHPIWVYLQTKKQKRAIRRSPFLIMSKLIDAYFFTIHFFNKVDCLTNVVSRCHRFKLCFNRIC